MELFGLTFQTAGEIMIAYTAIMVHHRVWKEHKIDDAVFKAMRRERRIGVLGIVFLAVGYLFHLLAR